MMPPSSAPSTVGGAPGRRDDGGLSDVRIVGAAREIIAEVGVDGLTMRDLSSRLGVSLGATYHHVPTKDALIQRVAQQLIDEVGVPPHTTVPWTVQVKAVILGVARAIGEYPGMAAWVLAHIDDIGLPRVYGELSAALERGGFEEESERESVIRALYLFGAGIATNVLPFREAAIFEHSDADVMFEDGIDMLLTGALRRAR